MLLSRTTLFLTGLISRLVAGVGLVGLEDLASWAWTLPDLRCRRDSLAEAVDAFRALVRRRVRGGEVGRWAEADVDVDAGPPSFRSALVRALSFLGTGLSSSALSSWHCGGFLR